MIDIGWAILASSRGVDTTCVSTEVIDDLESNRDWLLVDSLLELNLVTLGDVHCVANRKSEFG